MAVHTLCQSLVSFEDLLLEGIKHTKKLFLAWYTSTYTHTCMHADTAYTYTHTHEHTMHRHTPKHDIVLKGLLKSMTVLLILCGWCVHNKHPHLWVELCDQGKCPLKVLMTYLWSWGSSMLDTLSTGQDHWNWSCHWFDKVMSLFSLFMAPHQTHAVTSLTHKKHIIKYLYYLWQCQMLWSELRRPFCH